MKRTIVFLVGIFVFISIIIFGANKLEVFRPGEMININGAELYVRDYGKGNPTIIIESGLNCTNNLYYDLQRHLAKNTRVLSYNHAGIGVLNHTTGTSKIKFFRNSVIEKVKGASTKTSNPRTLPFYVEELRQMLAKKEIPPPYILVGHSLGGFIVRYYTYLYPEDVCGLVFIDAPHEDWFSYIKSNWSTEDQDSYFNWWDPNKNIPRYSGAGLEELGLYEVNCDSIRGKKIPSFIPVLMFTGNNKKHFRKGKTLLQKDFKMWAELQGELLENVEDATQIVDENAGHIFHADKPGLVFNKMDTFIDKCRKMNSNQ